MSQIPQGVVSCVPINASICYANAPLQACKAFTRHHFLVARKQIRLDHDTDYAILTGTQLVDDVVCHERLIVVVFAGVACLREVSGQDAHTLLQSNYAQLWVKCCRKGACHVRTMRAVNHDNFFLTLLP